MKISKKILSSSIVVVSIGLLFYAQSPSGVNEVNAVQKKVVLGALDKQQQVASKLKAKEIEIPHSHNHLMFEASSIETSDELALFDNSDIGIHLTEHLNMLEDTREGSQERQDKSLEKMRETPELYVEKLTEAYDKVERDNFLDRYKLVHLMENIKTAHALPFLAELAISESPEEIAPYEGDGHINEGQRESLIRMRAVGGLYALAKEGDDEARHVLLETISTTKDRTVKSDAIWFYLSTSKDIDADKEYLKIVLPETDHQLVTVKLSKIEEIQEQIEAFDENERLEDVI